MSQRKLHILNCKINATVHFFLLLKKSYLSPRFFQYNFTHYTCKYVQVCKHVIIDFGHIWGLFMAKIEKCVN